MAIDDRSAGMNAFEKRITAQVDYLGGIALTIARRLGWCVLLLAILASGCAYDVVVVSLRR